MYCLYMSVRVSLCWPKLVPVMALRALSLLDDFVVMSVMCCLNDMEVL